MTMFLSASLPKAVTWALLCLLPVTSPFPNAAGGCSGVNGSVDGPHLEGPILVSGSLGDGAFAVELQNAAVAVAEQATGPETVLSDGVTSDLQAGQEYIVKLSAQGGVPFKGFLFRLAPKSDVGSVDTTLYLTPSDDEVNSQPAEVCLMLDVGGVTQASALNMTVATSRLMVDQALELELQVTAVVHNDMLSNGTHRSLYYYDTYYFNVHSIAGGDSNTSTTTAGTSGAAATSLITLKKLLLSTSLATLALDWLRF